MSIINRKKLELIARKKLQYPLHDAEKDYFLTYVLNILSKSKLSNTLVFKGGTAIYHCYLDQYRFSEDLDFTSTNSNISLNDIQNVFSKFQYLKIKKKFVSKNTIKIERLKYSGILDTPNSTKIDIDKKQKVFLKPLNKTYSNVWGYNFSINVMDPVEICSEKIRACNERFRYRDFYDLYNLINILKIDLPNVFRILQKKELRKDLTKENILLNLKYTLNEIKEIQDNIFFKKKISNTNLISFFMNLQVPYVPQNVQ